LRLSDTGESLKIVITGAAGLLGSHLAALLSRDHTVLGLDRNAWWGGQPLHMEQGDLEDASFCSRVFTVFCPDVVIHCAALLNVDDCEEMPERAYAVNAALTRDLARSLPAGCLFVYVTTDGIFKGNTPFSTEADLPCPRTVYGRSKLHGEWEVQLATDNHLIVRTNFYGWSSGKKSSSAEWLFSGLAENRTITLFDDFFFTPIYVVDLAHRVAALIRGSYRGILNTCGGDRVSKLEFGLTMADVAGLSTTNVQRGSIDQANLRAPRPKDMSLSSERFKSVTGFDAPSCRSGLEKFVADHARSLEDRFLAAMNS